MQDPRRRHEGDQGPRRPDRRSALHRPARHVAAHLLSGARDRRRGDRRGPRLRRLLDPRLPGDPRLRHAADAGRDHRLHRPVLRPQDAGPDLRRARPGHQGILLARPARRRPQGRGAPQHHRHRHPRLLRPRGRVLRVRRRALRPERQLRHLRDRLGRGPLEHARGRGPEPRLQDPAQGGLLPGAALGHADGHPLRDGR